MARDLHMLLDSLIAAVEFYSSATASLNEYEGTSQESRLRAIVEKNEKIAEELKEEILDSYGPK